jgi:hypothetical protein
LPNVEGERTFELTEDIKLVLPDKHYITIPKGFKTDLISVPSWLWSIFKPIDKAFLGDLVHDYLWVNRVDEIKRFEGNIYKARKYSDDVRLQIRKQLAPRKVLKNYITHYFLRIFGGLYYSRQIKIPKR